MHIAEYCKLLLSNIRCHMHNVKNCLLKVYLLHALEFYRLIFCFLNYFTDFLAPHSDKKSEAFLTFLIIP